MENSNFIKDNRVFPEEMHATSHHDGNHNHTATLVWWIVGLLVMLAVVFLLGLWTGKETTEIIKQKNLEEAQVERQAIFDDFESQAAQELTAEERSERLRDFFTQR